MLKGRAVTVGRKVTGADAERSERLGAGADASHRRGPSTILASQARAAGPRYSLRIHGRRGIVVLACLLVVFFFRFRTIGIVVLLCLVLGLFLLGFCRSLFLCLLVFEYNA